MIEAYSKMSNYLKKLDQENNSEFYAEPINTLCKKIDDIEKTFRLK